MVYETFRQGIKWLVNNWIEIIGVLFTLVTLPLEVARKWTVWIIGIIGSLFYICINFSHQLYALSGLCSYNVLVSFYGLYCWKFAKTKNNRQFPFNFITKRLTIRLIPIGMVIWGLIMLFVIQYTDTKNPFTERTPIFSFLLDTLITSLGIIALWTTAKKIVESWFLWLASNVCSVILYLYKEMYPSTFLYTVYTVFTIFGYIFWKKQALKEV